MAPSVPSHSEKHCSPWLCLEGSELTACFFPHHDEEEGGECAVPSKSASSEDPRDVMAINDIQHNVEVSLEEFIGGFDKDVREDSSEEERLKLVNEERRVNARMKKAREEQNNRYLKQQQEERERKAAEAKEARRMASRKNAEEQKTKAEKEKGQRLVKADEKVKDAKERQQQEDKEERQRLAREVSEAEQLIKKTREGEMIRKAKEDEGEQQLARKKAAEEEGRAKKVQEEERLRNETEVKEARRLAQQKATETKDRMKKAREEQRKRYQKQHQENIHKKAEEVKETRRWARQQKMEEQKRLEEEKRARRLAEQQAESQRVRTCMESTKEQRTAWQAQQAAATAAQHEMWQKKWHAQHQTQQHTQQSYYAPNQQVPPPSFAASPNAWHPAASASKQSPPPYFGINGQHMRMNVINQKYQAHQPTTPCQQWRETTPNIQGQKSQSQTYSPPPEKATPETQPAPDATASKPADDNVQEEAFTNIQRNVMTTWALQPPGFQTLRPIHVLVTTIQNVFPTNHKYFVKWTPIADVSNDKKLKKAVRKIRVFLHPDKLPKDMNDEQLFVCKLLWDVTNDAWEHYNKATDELDWTK